MNSKSQIAALAGLLLSPSWLHGQNGGPPVYERIGPFLANPAADALYEIPVVIIRYLPTTDGRTGDVAYDPDYYSLNPLPLSAIKQRIDVLDIQIKFMLEEASRFRAYKNPSVRPALGYRVLDYITIYEPTPAGRLITLPSGRQVNRIDHHKIFDRINARRYVEEFGVKEFWIWTVGHDLSFPSYDPAVNGPGTGRSGWESNMSSPTTGDISNSDRDHTDLPVYNSTYVVYLQNYRRSAAEAVHNHGHQLEAILAWTAQRQDGSDKLFWGQFVGRQGGNRYGTGRAGWTHMPPNTTADYDYTNKTFVASDIEDWTPAGTGARKNANVDTWTSIRYAWPGNVAAEQPDAWWYVYWMQSMPGAGNSVSHSNGRVMTNWWELTADWDAANRARVGLHQAAGSVLLSVRNLAVTADGQAGAVSVEAPDAWIAVSNAPWIQITGTNRTSASWRVLANLAVDARTATIVLAGTPVQITQAGRACLVRLTPGRASIPGSGGDIAIDVAISPSDCAWTARTDVPWLTLASAPTNTGNAKVLMNAAVNSSGAERTGRLTVGDQTISFTQTTAATPIQITSVEHGASFGKRICANCWITIRGANLSATTRAWTGADFNGQRMPKALDGVQVTIDGVPAYLSFVSPSQINVLTPVGGTSTGTRVSVEVIRSQSRSNGFMVPTGAVAPEFFTAVDRAGQVRVAAVHVDGALVAPQDAYGPSVASRLARPGDTILLFGNGFGETSPAIVEGELPGQPTALAALDSLSVEIGGLPAVVSFAGLVSPGLWQLNVVVPAVNVPEAMVKATVSGVSSTAALRLATAR